MVESSGELQPPPQEGKKDNFEEVWNWFCRPLTEKSSTLVVTPSMVAKMLDHDASTTSLSCRFSTQELLPPTLVAQSLLEQCQRTTTMMMMSMEANDDAPPTFATTNLSMCARVALRLLLAPTTVETPWKAVSLLLQIMLLRCATTTTVAAAKQQNGDENDETKNDNNNIIPDVMTMERFIQAFWWGTMAGDGFFVNTAAAAGEAVHEPLSTTTTPTSTTTPRDYMMEWIPLIFRYQQQQLLQLQPLSITTTDKGLDLQEADSTPEARATACWAERERGGAPLLGTLLEMTDDRRPPSNENRNGSSDVDNDHNNHWFLNGLFAALATAVGHGFCSHSQNGTTRVTTEETLLQSTSSNHSHYPTEDSWFLGLVTDTLAPWMRQSDWMFCISHMKQLIVVNSRGPAAPDTVQSDVNKVLDEDEENGRMDVYVYHLVQWLLRLLCTHHLNKKKDDDERNHDDLLKNHPTEQKEAFCALLQQDMVDCLVQCFRMSPRRTKMSNQSHSTRRVRAKRAVERVCWKSNHDMDACLVHWMNLLSEGGAIMASNQQRVRMIPVAVCQNNSLPPVEENEKTREQESKSNEDEDPGRIALSTLPERHGNNSNEPQQQNESAIISSSTAILDWLLILSSVLQANAQLNQPGVFLLDDEAQDRQPKPPTMAAVWAFLEHQCKQQHTDNEGEDKDCMETDDHSQEMRGWGTTTSSSPRNRIISVAECGERLERILEKGTLCYQGKGSFQTQHRQRDGYRNHSSDYVNSKAEEGDDLTVVAQQMTYAGGLVAQALWSTTIRECNDDDDDELWLGLLDPYQVSRALSDNSTSGDHPPPLSLWIVLAVLVTALAESPRLRVRWVDRLVSFLMDHHQERPWQWQQQQDNDNAQEEQTGACAISSIVLVVCWGALYLVNAFLEHIDNRTRQDDNGDSLYDRCLVRLLKCSRSPELPPSHHLVRALLPRQCLRPLLFKHALENWLYMPNSAQDEDADGLVPPPLFWWGAEEYDCKEIALWTLVHLLPYYDVKIDGEDLSKTNRASIHKKERTNPNYWKPLLEFAVEDLPPVSTSLRSWFWDQALDDDFATIVNSTDNQPQLKRNNDDDISFHVKERLLRALLIRFFQFTDHPAVADAAATTPTTQQSKSSENKKRRTSGVSAYCSISLDRLFVMTSNKNAPYVPVEDLAALFVRIVLLQSSLLEKTTRQTKPPDWVVELVELLGVAHLFERESGHDKDAADSVEVAASGVKDVSLLDHCVHLCARIVIHYIVGSCGVEQNCSFTQLRKSLCCGDKQGVNKIDSSMMQSNLNVQRRLTKGDIPKDKEVFLQFCLRHHLADGLMHLLCSLSPLASSSSSSGMVVGAVCALTALQQKLRSKIETPHCCSGDEVSPDVAKPLTPRTLLPRRKDGYLAVAEGCDVPKPLQQISGNLQQPVFQEPHARSLRFLSQTFPHHMRVSLPFLSSILNNSVNRCYFLTGNRQHQNGSQGVANRYILLERTNLIVRSIMHFCNEAQSILQAIVQFDNMSVHGWNTHSLRSSVLNLYDSFCTKKALSTLINFLGKCTQKTKNCSTATSGQTEKDQLCRTKETSHDLLFDLSLVDIDRVSREIRRVVLCTIRSFLITVTESGESGDSLGEPSLYQFVNCMLGQCGRDLREGLQEASGGLSTDEYSSFMECMEACCECTADILLAKNADYHDVQWMHLLLQTCVEVANLAEDIVCSIAIRNRSILKQTMYLYHRTLPAIVGGIFLRSATCSFAEPELDISFAYKRFATQRLNTFNQCRAILLQWSDASTASPPRPWVDVVDPNHLRAEQKLGGVDGNSDNSDSEGERHSVTERQSIASPCRKPMSTTGKKRARSRKCDEKFLQLESDRPWTWAFCFILDVYGALVEDPFREMTNAQASTQNVRIGPRFSNHEKMEKYAAHRVHVIQEAFYICNELLSFRRSIAAVNNGSNEPDVFMAQQLPISVKSMFRHTLEKLLKVVARALNILVQQLTTNIKTSHQDTKADNLSFLLAEALACVVAWILPTNDESGAAEQLDISTSVRLWSCSEVEQDGPSLVNRSATNRLVMSNQAKVKNKQTLGMTKKLEKALGWTNDVEQALEELNQILQQNIHRLEGTLRAWDRVIVASVNSGVALGAKVNTDSTSSAMTFVQTVAAKAQQLQKQIALYADQFQSLIPQYRRRRKSNISTKQGEVVGSKKRLASSSHVASNWSKARVPSQATTATSSNETVSRNRLVQSWLEMDRETGHDETFQADAYADLEDFLVEG
ncbi:hypothetical protein ACA910_019554 [Epithemia clementina (nom. ined.)]